MRLNYSSTIFLVGLVFSFISNGIGCIHCFFYRISRSTVITLIQFFQNACELFVFDRKNKAKLENKKNKNILLCTYESKVLQWGTSSYIITPSIEAGTYTVELHSSVGKVPFIPALGLPLSGAIKPSTYEIFQFRMKKYFSDFQSNVTIFLAIARRASNNR